NELARIVAGLLKLPVIVRVKWAGAKRSESKTDQNCLVEQRQARKRTSTHGTPLGRKKAWLWYAVEGAAVPGILWAFLAVLGTGNTCRYEVNVRNRQRRPIPVGQQWRE